MANRNTLIKQYWNNSKPVWEVQCECGAVLPLDFNGYRGSLRSKGGFCPECKHKHTRERARASYHRRKHKV